MKSLSNNFSRYFLYLAITFFAVGVTSCSSDDDVDDVITPPQATGTITVNDQTLSQNTIIIDNVTVGQDSWLVVRNSGEDDSPEIVSEPLFLEEGSHDNVEVELTNTANITGGAEGDDFVIMIHEDTGTAGEWDYDGTSGSDNPITTSAGTNVSQTITVTGPSLSADDNQAITENNEVTFTSVNTATDGWIVLYGQNEDGSINEDDQIGMQYVEAGTHENFLVPFNEGYVHTPGSTVYPRLYMDNPADQEFTWTPDGTDDLPVTYGYDETGTGMYVGNSTTTGGGFTIQ